MVDISRSKKEALEEKMRELGVYEKDLKEKFIRSQGK